MVYRIQNQSTISAIRFTFFFQSITAKNSKFAKKSQKYDLEKQKQISILILQKFLLQHFTDESKKKLNKILTCSFQNKRTFSYDEGIYE